MQKIITFLKEHLSEIIIAVVSGLLFLILGICISYWINSNDKIDIQYSIKSTPIATSLQGDNPNNYAELNNQKFERLTLTTISIFNLGNKALDGSIISPKMPIQAALNNKYKIIKVFLNYKDTSLAPNFKLEIINNKIIPQFKYMNKGDKVSFSVIHDGGSDNDFLIKGNWSGFNGIRKYKKHAIDFSSMLLSMVLSMLGTFIVYKILMKLMKKEIIDLKNAIKANKQTTEQELNKIKKIQGGLKEQLSDCAPKCPAKKVVDDIDGVVDLVEDMHQLKNPSST